MMMASSALPTQQPPMVMMSMPFVEHATLNNTAGSPSGFLYLPSFGVPMVAPSLKRFHQEILGSDDDAAASSAKKFKTDPKQKMDISFLLN